MELQYATDGCTLLDYSELFTFFRRRHKQNSLGPRVYLVYSVSLLRVRVVASIFQKGRGHDCEQSLF